MSVGYPKNQASIDGIVGELTQSINRNFRRAVQLKTELDSYTDGQLTSAGYTAGEVAVLRTLVTDLNQLNNLYTGAATLGSAKDFRASLRPLWGVLGDF
jgi:hypothetical protein